MDVSIEAVTADFDRWVEGFVGQHLPEEQGKALRRVALDFTKRVAARTPVDTGRARGGWLPYADHVGEPTEPRGPGTAQGKLEGSFREDLRGRDMYIEITNGVPYIVFLEYGHSKQAPAGMVRVSLRELSAQKIDDEFEAAVERANRKAERG